MSKRKFHLHAPAAAADKLTACGRPIAWRRVVSDRAELLAQGRGAFVCIQCAEFYSAHRQPGPAPRAAEYEEVDEPALIRAAPGAAPAAQPTPEEREAAHTEKLCQLSARIDSLTAELAKAETEFSALLKLAKAERAEREAARAARVAQVKVTP
jgi:hypothetical protein